MDHEPPAEATKNLVFQKLSDRWKSINSMAGVGLDPDIDKIPEAIWQAVGGKDHAAEGIFQFNKQIIDATAQHAVDFKINTNFYLGSQGRLALEQTLQYLKTRYPQVLRVCDGKFADVGNTAEKIAEEMFDRLDADAVILNPYLGFDAIEPFTRRQNKAVILCINTSNNSASTIQNLTLDSGELLWRHILKISMSDWNKNNNIIPVLSATHPDNLKDIRQIIGNTPILLAGVGIQGGSLEKAVPLCLDSNGYGLMISSSRGILYPKPMEGETFVQASTRAIIELKNRINQVKNSNLSQHA